jgi:hypothetical protein
MSLKFAALGEIFSRRPFRASARVDDQTQNIGSAGSHEPIPIGLGWLERGAEREKRAPGVLQRFLNGAARIFTAR